MKGYPENMKIKTFTKDCFDGATETPETKALKEKYLPKMHSLAREFMEDCIDNQIESVSTVGFFFAWLYPEFLGAQIEVMYEHLHDIDGQIQKVYKFEKANR